MDTNRMTPFEAEFMEAIAFMEMDDLFTEMGLWELLLKEKKGGAQCG